MTGAERPTERPVHVWQGMRGRWCKGCQMPCSVATSCACCVAWAERIAQAIKDAMQEIEGTDNG